MNKIDKKKKEIVNHYNAIILNLGISFLTSVIGGLVSAILIAVIFGQTPSEIYRSFSTPLILWGLFLIVLFFIFFFIFWLIFVFVPRSKELKEDYDKIEGKEELCKLRLSKYQNLSIALISMGVGIFLAGQSFQDKLNSITWVGLIMIIVGVLIETFHVRTRYDILESYYDKVEKNKLNQTKNSMRKDGKERQKS